MSVLMGNYRPLADGPTLISNTADFGILLPTGSEEREVLGVGSIPVQYFPVVNT